MSYCIKSVFFVILVLAFMPSGLACEYGEGGWELKKDEKTLRKMRDIAADDDGNKEAEYAARLFRRVLIRQPKQWHVTSQDECECVDLYSIWNKATMRLGNGKEQCFPEYYYKLDKESEFLKLLKSRSFKKAYDVARQLTEKYTNYGKGYLFLGLAEVMKGNDELAHSYFERFKEISPNNPVSYAALAFFYQSTNKQIKARDANRKAISLEQIRKLSKRDDIEMLETAFGFDYATIDP